MHFVYILRSLSDGRYYIGKTNDLIERLSRHVYGRVKATRHRRPLAIVRIECYATASEASHRELLLKSYKGGEAFKRLLNTSRPHELT